MCKSRPYDQFNFTWLVVQQISMIQKMGFHQSLRYPWCCRLLTPIFVKNHYQRFSPGIPVFLIFNLPHILDNTWPISFSKHTETHSYFCRNCYVKETGQNLILFGSWKDLRPLHSNQSLINGPRKLMQLCRMKAEEKWQVII